MLKRFAQTASFRHLGGGVLVLRIFFQIAPLAPFFIPYPSRPVPLPHLLRLLRAHLRRLLLPGSSDLIPPHPDDLLFSRRRQWCRFTECTRRLLRPASAVVMKNATPFPLSPFLVLLVYSARPRLHRHPHRAHRRRCLPRGGQIRAPRWAHDVLLCPLE